MYACLLAYNLFVNTFQYQIHYFVLFHHLDPEFLATLSHLFLFVCVVFHILILLESLPRFGVVSSYLLRLLKVWLTL